MVLDLQQSAGPRLWRWVIRSSFSGFFAGFAFATILLLYFQPQLRPYHEFVGIVTLFLAMATTLSIVFWRLAHRSRVELQVPNYSFKTVLHPSAQETTEHTPELLHTNPLPR